MIRPPHAAFRGALLAALLFALLAAGAPSLADAFVDSERELKIAPTRGADPLLDYSALTFFGPWDDRNYELTREDLALLSANEAELGDPIPAFFRVAMRRAWPELPTSGPAQYPRSALQIFRQLYGGYLVGDQLYRKATREGMRFLVIMKAGIDAKSFDPYADRESLSGEVRVTDPNGAAESSIKVNPVNPAEVVAGTNGPNGGQRMHWSDDGGATWTLVNLPLGSTCCDPAVDWSSNGQFAYTTTLGSCGFFGCQVWFYRSSDGGRTWDDLEVLTPGDPRREIATSSSDKEYLHVDKFESSPYRDNIYVSWHQSNVQYFAVSTDFGNTFTSQSFSSDSVERGIGSDLTSDRQGRVYYFWPGTNDRTIRLKVSSDGGASFSATRIVASTQGAFDFPLPSMESRNVFIYVSADTDLGEGPYSNSIYAAWTDNVNPDVFTPSDNHGRIQVAYSRDAGQTWQVTTPHETSDQLEVDRYHPWLAVGPDGVVHVVYYDSRRDPSRQSVDLFYAYSTDGAQSWSTPQRVTTELSPNIADSFEFGDYNGLDIVMGDLIAIFTDNRSESGLPGDSVDVYAAGITPGSGSICGNNAQEPGEACDGADFGGRSCLDFDCTGGTLSCDADCGGVDTSGCLGCAGVVAGRIPGEEGLAGEGLLVSKSGADLLLDWPAACTATDDYAVYEGLLGDPASAAPKLCSTGGATAATITPAAGLRFYLVTAVNAGVEGSYGKASDASERAPATEACYPQGIGECP